MQVIALLTAALLALAGCALYALSQDKHWNVIAKAKPSPEQPTSSQPNPSKLTPAKKTQLKQLSLLAITLSLVVLVLSQGLGFAVLLWPLMIGAAIFSVALVLAYKPSLFGVFLDDG